MKGRILFVLIIHAMIATVCVNSKNKNTDQNEPLVIAGRTAEWALQHTGSNHGNPDYVKELN